ncbi:hypothetical protein ACX9MO_10055 [Pseudooceanicola sp. 502str34]
MIMNEKMERSLEGVLMNALRHCSRYRLSQHDLSRTPRSVQLGIASRMMDWLEEEVAIAEATVSGGAGARPSGSDDDTFTPRHTLTRSRSQAR